MNAQLTETGGKVRLYVEVALADGARVEASEGQAHYLLHVMRAKAGDRMSLFNGRDGEWLARLDEASKRGCVFLCEKQAHEQNMAPDLWLCFAPIKKTPANYVVQKAAELGVSMLQPVITRRTIVSRINLERMRANAIEAAEQSDRLDVPEVREPVSLDRLLRDWPAERRILFCDEGGDALPIVEALAEFLTSTPPPLAGGGKFERDSAKNLGEGAQADLRLPQSSLAAQVRVAPSRKGRGNLFVQAPTPFAILTGPEGGFDPAERDTIRAQEFVIPVSLGPRILRADTAALASLAVYQALKGDWR